MSGENTFIGSVCRWVIDNHSSNLHEVTVVVPAKRSIRFFSNELVSEFTKKNKASIIPEIITLTDLFEKLTPFAKLTQVELIFHFYKVYVELEEDPEPFEQFFTWAPSLLADFNEIDNYLIDPKLIFTDLRNLKEQEIIIEGWSFDNAKLSQGQENLNEFWIKLPKYYQALKKYLIKNKISYSGLINRTIVDNLSTVFTKHNKRKFVFAGFNALTKCEISLINYLVEQKDGKVFFDTDTYYLQKDLHEAGLFMRNHKRDFNNNVDFINANSLANTSKNITFYESNGEALQCNELVKIIAAMPVEQLQRTAIVLCNEQLLPVLINSLPSEISRINVTMGWPLKFTRATDFFNALIDLNIAFTRNKNFIQAEIIDNFIFSANSFLNLKISSIELIKSKIELIDLFKSTDVIELLNATNDSIANFLKVCLAFVKQNLNKTNSNSVEAEILAHYNEVFNKLVALPGLELYISNWFLFKQLFNKFVRNYPLAFVGEPLSGIQVMGMLETRAIDFDTVFILSANEGYLPATAVYTGFIPYDLRAHFKLPGKLEQDAVFAYYFYRLIQRSSTIHVFYNTQNELLQQAERSRYLLQIENELTDINSNIKFSTRTVDAQLNKISDKFCVNKSSFYFERLNQLSTTGFSATMLLTYCTCKLDFYNKYILSFRQEKDLHELDESGIGNMVHYYFNSIFSKIVGQIINHEFFKNELAQLDKSLQLIIEEKFKSFNFNSGQNFLALQMVKKMISSFLIKQIENTNDNLLLNKIVVGTEINLQTQLTIQNNQLNLKGGIDLLLCDELENYFILDFKTGNVDVESLKITNNNTLTFELFSSKAKLIQLLIYHKLVSENYKTNSLAEFIIPLATGSNKLLATELKNISGAEITDSFLQIVIGEMLNKEIVIEHNEKSKFCEFCN